MPRTARLVLSVMILGIALAGCSRMSGGPTYQFPAPDNSTQQPTVTASQPQSSPVERLEQQAAGLNVSGFIDASAASRLSEKDRSEASSAQFYALQFGRPGAPRNWSGDSGASGQVTVGPFIRVNNLDCREFTHEVTVSGQAYSKSGTSCRELSGNWQVVNAG